MPRENLLLTAYLTHHRALIDSIAPILGCRFRAEDVVQDAWIKLAEAQPQHGAPRHDQDDADREKAGQGGLEGQRLVDHGSDDADDGRDEDQQDEQGRQYPLHQRESGDQLLARSAAGPAQREGRRQDEAAQRGDDEA